MEKQVLRSQLRREKKRKTYRKYTLHRQASIVSTAIILGSIVSPIATLATTGSSSEEQVTNKKYEGTTQTNEVTLSSKEFEGEETSETNTSTDTTDPVDEENEPTETEEVLEDAEAPRHSNYILDHVSASDLGLFSQRRSSPAQFIGEVASHAQKVAAANDLYASVMIAQAVLESGWGGSSLASAPNHNLFGIKGSYNGQFVMMQTKEYLNGKWVTVNAKFRKYPSYQESFGDNAYVLRNTSFSAGNYFYSGAWKSNTKSYRDATSWLTGRYATDPSYNTKLNTLIETYNLTQYDTPQGTNTGNTGNGSGQNTNTNNPNTSTNSNTGDTIHTVSSGETLWSLAQRYQVSVAQIKEWNKLSSDSIYVNQKLIVKKGTSSSTNNNTNTSNNGSGGSSNNSSNTGNTSTAPVNGSTHTVVRGETLWSIATKYGKSVAQIKSWNKLSSDTIYVGQKLIVNANTTNSNANTSGNNSSNNTSSTNPSTSGETTHTVVPGDTLWGLSMKYKVSVSELKSWNKLSSDNIYIGQKLNVKASGGSSSTNTNTSNTGNTASSGTSTSNQNKMHSVVLGDTLWGLSMKYNVSVATLKSWNNMKQDTIFLGQKLIVGKSNGATNTTSTNTNTNNTTATNYTVKSGDSLWGIAQKNNTSVQQLKSWNKLQTDKIFIGQKLRVK